MDATSANAGSQCLQHHEPAAWHCGACGGGLCERCVELRLSHGGRVATCRACGGLCAPIESGEPRPQDDRTAFVRRLPRALVYPVRGSGWAVLGVGAVCIWGAGWFMFVPVVGLVVWMTVMMYLLAFMMSIVSDSTSGERELPGWPDLGDPWDEVVKPGLTMLFVGIVCFSPAYAAAEAFGQFGPLSWALLGAGLIYYPMALLSVNLHESIFALSPHLVVPAMRRVVGDYAIACLVLAGAFGLSQAVAVLAWVMPLGGLLGVAGVLYLAALEMHILGILYHANRDRFAWFRSSGRGGEADRARPVQ